MATYDGLSVTQKAECLVSAFNSMPFKDDNNIAENSNEDCLSLLKGMVKSKSRKDETLESETVLRTTANLGFPCQPGVFRCVEEQGGSSNMKEGIFLEEKSMKMISNEDELQILTLLRDWYEPCTSLYYDEPPMMLLERNWWLVHRSAIEIAEIEKDVFALPACLWMGLLNLERDYFSSFSGMVRKALDNISFQQLHNMKEQFSSKSNVLDVIQAVLKDVNKVRLFVHLVSTIADCSLKGGNFSIPATVLCSSSRPKDYFSTKFFGQWHAVSALRNILPSTTDCRDSCVSGKFLFHDPKNLYSEEFARDLSYFLCGTSDLSLQLDLSADETSLLPSVNGQGTLSQLFEEVNKRPSSIVLLKNIDQAPDSVIDALCLWLTGGCTLQGTRVDLSRTVFIMIFDKGHSVYLCEKCPVLSQLSGCSSKLMDLASDNSYSNAAAKAHISPKIWNLLDDVVILDTPSTCHAIFYTRFLLREIAVRFCGGRLIIYPSQAALEAIAWSSVFSKDTGIAPKTWLEEKVVPILQDMVANKMVDEKSIVFIDTYVGTKELSYRVEKADNCKADSDLTQNFSMFAIQWRAIIEKGKILEEIGARLKELLVQLRAEESQNSRSSELEMLVKLIDQAVDVANDINIIKEALGFSAEKKENGVGRDSKRQKAAVGGSSNSFTGKSSRPTITDIVGQALFRNEVSTSSRSSPSSYLLLGLNDDGKKVLLNELRKNLVKDGGVHLFKIDSSEFSEEDSVRHFLSRPSRDGCGWLHLVETVKDHPNSILCFDHIERAHHSLFSLLISLLTHGTSLDGKGNKVDFGKAVILISSDVGNKDVICKLFPQGAESENLSSSTGLGVRFRTVVLTRVDEVFIFNPSAHLQQLELFARIPITAQNHYLRFIFACLLNEDVDLTNEAWSCRLPLLSEVVWAS